MDCFERRPKKDLDMNFIIPKAKTSADYRDSNQSNSVLANAYENISNNFTSRGSSKLYERSRISTDPTEIPLKRRWDESAIRDSPERSLKKRWDEFTTNSTEKSKRTWDVSATSYDSSSTEDRLKIEWDVPKTPHATEEPRKRSLDMSRDPKRQTYKGTFKDLYDATLPKDLLQLFQPLLCKLCMFQAISNAMAKLHYGSKKHDRNVRLWLLEYSQKTGEPLHERATKVKTKAEEGYNPKYFHCDVCDLHLTGKIHAESHYMGKNHQRALHNQKNPAGKGFYNEEGKWVRTAAAKNDPVHGDGFGQDFIRTIKLPTPIDNNLRCELCNVAVSSVPQLEMHLKGTKHQKRVKQQQQLAEIPLLDVNSAAASEEPPAANPDGLSIYRTPSGQFFCKFCDLSLNSPFQFTEHLNSKKHVRKVASYREVTPPPPQTADDIFMHL